MQKDYKNMTQMERLSEELKDLKIDITRADRDEYGKQNMVSKSTISNYLSGIGTDADRASGMLVFFRSRIASRETIIAKN
jgi:hypothetical protein